MYLLWKTCKTHGILGKIILKKGDVVLLNGDLGAGKTAFTKGVARYFELSGVTSPTYAYLNVYGDLIYHYDCYRLSSGEDAERLGLTDYFNKDNILKSKEEYIYIISSCYDADNNEEVSKTIKAKKGIPGFLSDSIIDTLQALIMQNGLGYIDVDAKKVTFCNDKLVEIFDWYKDCCKKGYFAFNTVGSLLTI